MLPLPVVFRAATPSQPPPHPATWKIPREWDGETCYLIGGGPSLKDLDPDRLRGRRVIVINRGFRAFPFADVLYFCDANWWRVDGPEVKAKFTGKYIITASRADDPLLKHVKRTGTSGLELQAHGIKHGTNSGYQAINVAFHFGVKRIILLGYDMKTKDGATHFHGGYGTSEPTVAHVLAARMLPFFSALVEPLRAHGVEVLNANPDSALDCWPKVSIDEALA